MNAADTAWILTSTALVLFMTLPGLALFYGGLVRSANVLSVLMQCTAIACLASVLWLICGYSLAFSPGSAILGSLDKAFLIGVERETVYAGTTLPESVFFMFQMTFAIITPALIVGAFVERMKFGAVLAFSGLWLIVVYAPVAHWIWGGGWLAEMGVMDFAGGLVVHLTAGVSALVVVALLGSRAGFPADVKPPHAPWMTMAGASMLWVGWFGFNAGSALTAGSNAGMAMLVTHVSAATASLVWMGIEWTKFGKPSLVGLVTGTIAGLASITPASGFVGPIGALIIGAAGGSICYVLVSIVKQTLKFDDSLDVFAVHGVGGLLGTLLVAFLAAPSFGGAGLPQDHSMTDQFGIQLLGVLATAAWSVIASLVILKVVQMTIGLRVTKDQEIEGLDIVLHEERGYNEVG